MTAQPPQRRGADRDMCSSVSFSMNWRPVPGSTRHMASSALSRVSRGVSETATGGGAGSPAPFCCAPASRADRTRANTRLGSVSSRRHLPHQLVETERRLTHRL